LQAFLFGKGENMSFFQNPFNEEFRGSIPLGDRQYNLTFSVPANRNQTNGMIAWNLEPYDLSTYDQFTINFAIDNSEFKNYVSITVDISGATAAATTANEIVTILNANAQFSSWFTAMVVESNKGSHVYRVGIKANTGKQMRVYIANSGAERILGFNKYAGVAELPSYFSRHTIANRFTYADCQACLVELDETDAAVDQPIIVNAGFVVADMKEDWELLAGRVGIFDFQKITYDGSDRISTIILYPAGATVGDLGKKTYYQYDGATDRVTQIAETPYVLQSGDLITP